MHYDKNNKIIYDCGDWVTRVSENHLDMGIGDTDRVEDVGGTSFRLHRFTTENGRGGSHEIFNFRPATQEEINKATGNERIMVGEYEVEFEGYGDNSANGNIFIKVGCVRISKELFLKIAKRAGWK